MPRVALAALVLALTACASDAPDPEAPNTLASVAVTDAPTVAPVSEAPVPEIEPAPEDGSDGTPYEALRSWVGHEPVREDGAHFVLDPSVRSTIEEAFYVESGLMERLRSLDQDPTFLAKPVDFAGGAFALAFAPAEGQDDPRSLWMLIEAETGAVYALLAGDGDVYYRASHDARIDDLRSEAIAWMEEQSGEPFADLALLSEEAPIGP